MIKIAIIGATGTTYKRTIPALADSKICKVTAIQGRNIDKLNEVAEKYSINKKYIDVEKMLIEADIDLIYIGTPPFLHYKEIGLAAKTKKPIICEKPLSTNYEEGLKISKLVHGYSTKNFMVAHHLRHQPAINDIKRIIESGELGIILNVNMQWGFEMNLTVPKAEWKTNPKMAGMGTFSDNGIHIIDLVLHLFGNPKYVSGHCTKQRTKNIYDNETALLEYENTSVTLLSSQSMKYPGNHIQIYGTKGKIEAFDSIGEKSIKEIIIQSEKRTEKINYKETNLYKNEVEDFCKNLKNNQSLEKYTTLKEGLSALRIIDLIRKSSEDFNNKIEFTWGEK